MGINGDFLWRFLWLRINIDVTKPLRVQLRDSLEVVILLVMYEKLTEFCYKYGRIRHIYRECLEFEPGRMQGYTGQKLNYGPWLHDSIPIANEQ